MAESVRMTLNVPSRPERRVAVRIPSTQETCCHFATIDRIQGRWAKVRDLSKAGLCIIINHAFDSGQRLVIELPTKTASAIGISARVVRVVDQKDGNWLVGCWFGRLLSDEEFHALL
jgi:hypothetical protein